MAATTGCPLGRGWRGGGGVGGAGDEGDGDLVGGEGEGGGDEVVVGLHLGEVAFAQGGVFVLGGGAAAASGGFKQAKTDEAGEALAEVCWMNAESKRPERHWNWRDEMHKEVLWLAYQLPDVGKLIKEFIINALRSHLPVLSEVT